MNTHTHRKVHLLCVSQNGNNEAGGRRDRHGHVTIMPEHDFFGLVVDECVDGGDLLQSESRSLKIQ